MYSHKNIIEKTKIIPIKKSPSTDFNIEDKDKEYSLKQNIFDPTNFSPPNNFLLKSINAPELLLISFNKTD